MDLRKEKTNISRWDLYSLIIIFFAVLIQILKWGLLPIFLDVYYHLLSASGFKEAGGWLHSCFWEYAPIGRPQLYPPLLHFIILFFLKLGLPFLVVGKLIQVIIYPLLLFTVWLFIRTIFDKRQAFFATLLIFSPYNFYLTAMNTSAASLSLIFCLLSLLFFEKRKNLPATLLLAVSFYTHGFTSWIFLGVFVFYGLLNREKFIACIKVVLFALILSSPMIIFQFLQRDYFILQRNIVENYYFDFDLFNWLFLPFGLIACLRKKGKYFIFIALFISALIFLVSGFVFRYLSFYGIIGIILMNSTFFNDAFSSLGKNKKIILFSSVVLFCFVFSPTLSIDLSQSKISRIPKSTFYNQKDVALKKGSMFGFDIIDSNLMNFLFYCAKPNIRTNETSIYFPKLFKEVTEVINDNTSPDDIIFSNVYALGGMISLLSARATSSAMLSEIRPYNYFDQVAVAKLIIWAKDLEDMNREPNLLIENYNLRKIADTTIAFIYENPHSNFKKQRLSATVSCKIIFILLFLISMLIVAGAKFGIDK